MSATDARAARLALERLLPPDPSGAMRVRLDALERYVELLLDANRRLNLTRVVDPDAVARLHLLDSIAALPLVDAAPVERALDLGSGGGVPGIVLAICRPHIRWTLVDAVRKKADALRGFAAELRLDNVTVVAERAEQLGRDPEHRERHDVVTARACAALPVLAEYALPLLTVGGRLLAWKARMDDGELDAGARAGAILGGHEPSVVPAGHPELGDHRFVAITKVGPTPERYPRRPGEPSRRPLG